MNFIVLTVKKTWENLDCAFPTEGTEFTAGKKEQLIGPHMTDTGSVTSIDDLQ